MLDEQNNLPELLLPNNDSQNNQEIDRNQSKNSFWGFIEKNFLALSILVSGVMISGSLLYMDSSVKLGSAQINPNNLGQVNTKVDVSADNDAFLGKQNAPVTIIEFSDYQCPFCRTFWRDSLPQIKKEYIDTGKVKFVYRDYPLSFHAGAKPAAIASECSREQSKFWEMHDKIFNEQDKRGQGTINFTNDDLKKWAAEIGLNSGKFNQCFDSGKYEVEVQKDFNDGSTAGVTGTPAFFINGRLVVGAQPYAAFKAIIEEEFKK